MESYHEIASAHTQQTKCEVVVLSIVFVEAKFGQRAQTLGGKEILHSTERKVIQHNMEKYFYKPVWNLYPTCIEYNK